MQGQSWNSADLLLVFNKCVQQLSTHGRGRWLECNFIDDATTVVLECTCVILNIGTIATQLSAHYQPGTRCGRRHEMTIHQ